MKQIKDVEKLKEKFAQIIDGIAMHAVPLIGYMRIEEIIDSLAVEAPEVKPGAINSVLARFSKVRIWCNTENENIDIMMDQARAELAQLQADKKYWEDEAEAQCKQRCDLMKENGNLRGALRTLAIDIESKRLDDYGLVKYGEDFESDKKNVKAIIDHALANPTEEVEG